MSDNLDDLEAELLGMDTDNDFNDAPPSDREVVVNTLTDTAEGFTGSLMHDTAGTAKDIAMASIPSKVQSEVNTVVDIKETLTSQVRDAARGLRGEARGIMRLTDNYLPKQGNVRDVANKIKDMLGMNNKGNFVDKEAQQLTEITNVINSALGEKTEREKVEEILKDKLAHKNTMTALNLSAITANRLESMDDFKKSIQSDYYRKSLEVQLQALFISKEHLETTKLTTDVFKNQLESIVKNTALPDFLKLKSTEALQAKLRDNIFDSKIEALFKTDGWVDNFKNRMSRKISDTGNSIKEGLSQVNEIGETLNDVNDMADMGGGGSKGGMAGEFAADFAKGALGKRFSKFIESNETANNRLNKFKDFMLDPSDYFERNRTNSVSRFIYKNMGDLLTDDVNVNNTSISSIGANEPMIFDKRAHSSIISIPNLLQEIISELKKGNGENPTEKRFDFERSEFVEKETVIKEFDNSLKSHFVKNNGVAKIQGMLPYLLDENSSEEDIIKTKKALTSYILDGHSSNPKRMLDNEFADYLPEDLKDAILKNIESHIDTGDTDKDYATKVDMINRMNEIRKSMPNPKTLVQEIKDSNNTDLLEDEDLVEYDTESKDYKLKADNYKSRVVEMFNSDITQEDIDKANEDIRKRKEELNSDLVDSVRKKKESFRTGFQETIDKPFARKMSEKDLSGIKNWETKNSPNSNNYVLNDRSIDSFAEVVEGKFNSAFNSAKRTANEVQNSEEYKKWEKRTAELNKKKRFGKDTVFATENPDTNPNNLKPFDNKTHDTYTEDVKETANSVKDKLFEFANGLRNKSKKQVADELKESLTDGFSGITQFGKDLLNKGRKNYTIVDEVSTKAEKVTEDIKEAASNTEGNIDMSSVGSTIFKSVDKGAEAVYTAGATGTKKASKLKEEVLEKIKNKYNDDYKDKVKEYEEKLSSIHEKLKTLSIDDIKKKVSKTANSVDTYNIIPDESFKFTQEANANALSPNTTLMSEKLKRKTTKLTTPLRQLIEKVTLNDINNFIHGSEEDLVDNEINKILSTKEHSHESVLSAIKSRYETLSKNADSFKASLKRKLNIQESADKEKVEKDFEAKEDTDADTDENASKPVKEKRSLSEMATSVKDKIFNAHFLNKTKETSNEEKETLKAEKEARKTEKVQNKRKSFLKMFDKDNSGERDGNWRDLFKKAKEKKKEQAEQTIGKVPRASSGSSSNVMALLTLASTAVGILGKLFTGSLTTSKILWKIVSGIASVGGSLTGLVVPALAKLGLNLITKLPGAIVGSMSALFKTLKFGGKVIGALSKGARYVAGGTLGAASTIINKVAGNKIVAKKATETAAKAAGKGVLKSISKKIPGIGLLFGLGYGAKRLFDGDYTGAAAEVASGAASTIPGVGTAGSIAIDAMLAKRDYDKQRKEEEEKLHSLKSPNDGEEKPRDSFTGQPANVSNFGGGIANLKARGGKLADVGVLGENITHGKHVDSKNLNPMFSINLNKMANEYFNITGRKVRLNSAYRDPEYQRKLYKQSIRDGKKGSVAYPGRSMHNFGLAVDMPTKLANELDELGLMRKYGFLRPVGGEGWHVEAALPTQDINRVKKDVSLASKLVAASPGKGGGGWGTQTGVRKYSRNRKYEKNKMMSKAQPVDSVVSSNKYLDIMNDDTVTDTVKTSLTSNTGTTVNNVTVPSKVLSDSKETAKAMTTAINSTNDGEVNVPSVPREVKTNKKIASMNPGALNDIHEVLKESLSIHKQTHSLLESLVNPKVNENRNDAPINNSNNNDVVNINKSNSNLFPENVTASVLNLERKKIS